MSLKKCFPFLVLFAICIISLLNITVFADSPESNSPDSEELMYWDAFAVSDDNNYLYCISDGFIIRYDAKKNKVKKLKKLPDGQTSGCMLMGDYIVFELNVWYSKKALESQQPRSYVSYVYKYNLKTKELSVVIEGTLSGINKDKDRIFCYTNEDKDITVNIDGLDKRKDNTSKWSSFIKSKMKKKKGVAVKETKSYRGYFKNVYKKTKKGNRKLVKRVYEKWKPDKNHIVLKTSNKKNVVLAKNAILQQDVFDNKVYYFDNFIVINYVQYSKYLYRYDLLSTGEGYVHMMVVSYDGKHKKKIY